MSLTRHVLGSAAHTVHDALDESADVLQAAQPAAGHRHSPRMTLLMVAGACLLLGFLWAKAQARTY